MVNAHTQASVISRKEVYTPKRSDNLRKRTQQNGPCIRTTFDPESPVAPRVEVVTNEFKTAAYL
jgi:hypothetical protein